MKMNNIIVVAVVAVIACILPIVGDYYYKEYEEYQLYESLKKSAEAKRREEIRQKVIEARSREEIRQIKIKAERQKKIADEKSRLRHAPAPIYSAEAVYDKYRENEPKADRMYTGKRIALSGLVGKIRESSGDIIVDIANRTGTNAMCLAKCYFSDNNDKKEAIELQTGAPVTIQGVCDGTDWFGHVKLNDCFIRY
jgi:hypothetical protein